MKYFLMYLASIIGGAVVGLIAKFTISSIPYSAPEVMFQTVFIFLFLISFSSILLVHKVKENQFSFLHILFSAIIYFISLTAMYSFLKESYWNQMVMSFVTITVVLIIPFLSILLILEALWIIYSKAGKEGFLSLIPIVNITTFLEVIEKPKSYMILMLIPIVNFITIPWFIHELSKRFEGNIGMTIGIIILPQLFLPLIAWGNFSYTPIPEEENM